MADFYIERNTSVVDGSAYTANDKIIIRAGARGNLLLRNFNGNGRYITITNERTTSNARVEITSDNSAGWGVISIQNCKYIDLRGDNNSNLEYGFKITNVSARANTVWTYGESHHIKIGYTEIAFDDPPIGNGMLIGDSTLTSEWTFDTFDIHHNYIHGAGYGALYLGMNNPLEKNMPYVANVTVHDNLMEDLGAYGMTLKGVNPDSGPCSIYNNIIRGSSGGQSTGLVTEKTDQFKTGIGVGWIYGNPEIDVYNNWIEKTVGAGIKIRGTNRLIHNNIILGCGTGNDVRWGQGILVYYLSDDVHIYDNIIIQPTQYAIFALNGANIGGTTIFRNLIGDAGLGEWGEETPSSGRITESTGADANIYHQNVADFGFNRWSDDGDYSNDDFTFGGICEGVTCPDYCDNVNHIRYYNGICDPSTGECVYDTEIDSVACGFDPCEGILPNWICEVNMGGENTGWKTDQNNCHDAVYDVIECPVSGVDPCDGVTCEDFCDNETHTRYFDGVCDPSTGECVYAVEENSVECGYVPPEGEANNRLVLLGALIVAGLALSVKDI